MAGSGRLRRLLGSLRTRNPLPSLLASSRTPLPASRSPPRVGLADIPSPPETPPEDPGALVVGVTVGIPCPVCGCDTARIVRYDSVDRRPWGMELECKLCHYEWYHSYFEDRLNGSFEPPID